MRCLGLVCCAVMMASGCADSRWDGRVETWGGMRQVMRDGETEARVTLAEVVAKPHAFGVGAVEGLRGEIVIDDGRYWLGQVEVDSRAAAVRVTKNPPQLRATLLAVAYVPNWSEAIINVAVSSDELEAHVRDDAHRVGIDTARPFPFVIEGELRGLGAHVINGYCPMSPDAEHSSAAYQPFRYDGWSGRGKLIGLYAEDSPGQLTHHGSSMHMHVLLQSSPPLVAHVERVALGPGAILRLPVR